MAKMKMCDKGHNYDPKKHSSCPFCAVPGLDVRPARPGTEDDTVTVGRTDPAAPDVDKDATVRRGIVDWGIDPVVGWLVCIEGADRGRSYLVKSERNFIGRSEKMNICIHGDDTISRENHATISFNPRNNNFKLSLGESRGLVYLNQEEVDVPTTLKPYDIIELGRTKLIFVPLCGERFQWE
jgi:hypothetical protein